MPSDNVCNEWRQNFEELISKIGTGTGMIAVIIGNRGAGKTQMASCAIKESCKRGKSAMYAKAVNFFLSLRESYRKDSAKSEKDVLRDYLSPKLLVIDAIENRSESSFENLMLNHLIDMRYDWVLDTILISNQTEKEFAASMGPSIVDRIHECGLKIVCNWQSFRRSK